MPQDPCNGGAIVTKPGVARTVLLSTAAIEAALAFLDPIVAVILAPIIALFTYDTATICSAPPPSDPGLTATDVANAVAQFNPAISIPAQQKVRDWFLSWYWYKLCDCATIATPAAPIPSNPGTTASKNPGIATAPTTQPCWDQKTIFEKFDTAAPFADRSQPSLPFTSQVNVTPTGVGTPSTALLIPSGVTAFTVTWSRVAGANDRPFVVLSTFDNTGTGNQSFQFGSGGTPGNQAGATSTFSLHAGSVSWQIWAGTDVAHVGSALPFEISFLCSGQVGQSIASPCCPPDPLVDQQLRQIMSMVTSIYQALSPPLTSYAESTVHSGLSGNGSVALQGTCIGVKVIITSDTSGKGQASGNPNYLFDRGFIVPIAVEGPIRAPARLTFNPQLFQIPTTTDAIGYTLTPGVTISIVELLRGP
jgi:hypothetical protein